MKGKREGWNGHPALKAARGASAIYNNLDLMLRLVRHGDEPSDPRRIEVEGTRAEDWPDALYYELRDDRLVWLDSDQVETPVPARTGERPS